LAKSERVLAAALVSCHPVRLRRDQAGGGAIALGMPASDQLGDFANGIWPFLRL
jgi:hypothetical protein